VEPVVAVRRERDELTSFISVSPDPPADATVAVSAKPAGSPAAEEVDEAAVSDSVAAEPEVSVDTTPVQPAAEAVEPEPVAATGSKTPPVVPDSEETLMLEIPQEPEQPPSQEATLFFEVPRVVVGKLVVIKGELKGEQYELHEGDNQIGRSPESDVVLPSMWISRSHAILRCRMGQIEIESISDKITSVDGEPVSGTATVPDGAKIQMGGTVCRVELEG